MAGKIIDRFRDLFQNKNKLTSHPFPVTILLSLKQEASSIYYFIESFKNLSTKLRNNYQLSLSKDGFDYQKSWPATYRRTNIF